MIWRVEYNILDLIKDVGHPWHLCKADDERCPNKNWVILYRGFLSECIDFIDRKKEK